MFHFEQNMIRLNPCAKPHVPLKQVNIEYVNNDKDKVSAEIEMMKEAKIVIEPINEQSNNNKIKYDDRWMQE